MAVWAFITKKQIENDGAAAYTIIAAWENQPIPTLSRVMSRRTLERHYRKGEKIVPPWLAIEVELAMTHANWAPDRRIALLTTELGNETTAMLAGAAAFAVFIAWFFRSVRGNNGRAD